MNDALDDISDLYWRGFKLPVTTRELFLQHGNIRHPISFGKGEKIQPGSTKNLVFTYTVPMRENLAVAGYPDLFTQGLPRLLRDCINQEPGPLVDPIHGKFVAVPETYRETADPDKRDGVDVQLEFIQQPPLSELSAEKPLPTARTVAIGTSNLAAATAAKNASNDAYAGALAAAGEADEAAQQAQTATRAPDLVQNMETISRALEDYETEIERLEDPTNYPMVRESRRLRLATYDVGRRVSSPGKTWQAKVTAHETTVGELAAAHAMPVAALIEKNPKLAKSPRVKRGTAVTVYR